MSDSKLFSLDKLAVIIPVHTMNEEMSGLLTKAVESVPEGIDVFVVGPDAVVTALPDHLYKIANNTSNQDFCGQINEAIDALPEQYEFVSILEVDDTFNKTVLNNALNTYINAKPDYDVYLTLQYLVDSNQGMFIGFANEMPLAMPKDGVFGELDEEFLKEVYNLNLTGAIIRRSVFVKFKPSIKIYFWYEWLLRVMRNGSRVYTIPKVAYNHLLMREGSIFAEYQKTVTGQENNYWLNVARESSKLDEDATTYVYQAPKSAEA